VQVASFLAMTCARKKRKTRCIAVHAIQPLILCRQHFAGLELARTDLNNKDVDMSEHNKAILEKANALFAKGDFEGFLSFCTEDTKWTYVGDRTLEGKEAVRRYIAETYTEPSKFTVVHSIAEGDFVTLLGDITLKDDDGKDVPYAFCDVWRFRDGKMAELKAFVIKA
jgi:ketosteroid isomerase-like protein